MTIFWRRISSMDSSPDNSSKSAGMEKEAKSRTVKYLQQLIDKYGRFHSTDIANHIKALPENQMSHVKDSISRVINSNEKFRKGLTPEYETLLRDLRKGLNPDRPRLGVYDVSHLPSYTSQSLAIAASPALRAATNDIPGKIPFVSRLLSKFPGMHHFVPRYKVQRTDVDFTPQQLNTIRDTSDSLGKLQHYNSPMYEVVLPNQGPNAPRLVQNLYGIETPTSHSSSAGHAPLTEKSIVDQLRLRFGDESVQTIDKLIADASPSKLYHGGNVLTSVPGARGYTGRRSVEARGPLPDGVGLHEHKLLKLISDADRALLTNPNTSKLGLAFTRPGLYFGHKLAKRFDEAAKGKTWYTAIPRVGHAYANHWRRFPNPANVFVPEHVYNTMHSDWARLRNAKSFPSAYLPDIARLLSPD